MASNVTTFVRELTPLAVEIGDRYGINPALIITQAAIETGWGSEVAGNNYFGVKSHGRPGGQQVATHEEINGRRVAITDNFRQYGSLAESMDDYAQFLRDNPRYAGVFEAGDLQGQLDAIAASGYATDSNYPALLRGVSRLVTRNMAPLPPGQIPTVASELDTTSPLFRFDSMGNPVNAETGERVLASDPAYSHLMAFQEASGNVRPPRVAPTPAPASQRPGSNAQPSAPGARLPAIGPTGGPSLDGTTAMPSRSAPAIDDIGSMPSYAALGEISGATKPDTYNALGGSGITRTQGIAGTVAMPPGARPNVPSTDVPGVDDIGAMPTQAQFRTLMQPVTVENPAYTRALTTRSQVPLGEVIHTGSRDTVAQQAAGQAMARNMPPRWITRMQQVTVPLAASPAALLPVAQAPNNGAGGISNIPGQPRQMTGIVQGFRNQGLSPSEAYSGANASASSRAISNSSNPSGNATRSRLASQYGFD